MAMQYPLLFPYGEDRYRVDIEFREKKKTCDDGENKSLSKSRKFISAREYYAYRLQQRKGESHILLRSGRLLQQFIVDAYTCIEEERLRFIRLNQSKLRSDLFKGLQDAILRGDTNAEKVGKRMILPSSYIAGPRYKVQNYQDAMGICRVTGYPDLFITFTCNPKWEEIRDMMADIGDYSNDPRLDIICRVFHAKLAEMMNDIKKKKYFGRVIANVYAIEFQKRGLPHAHILIFLHPDDKYPTPSMIDKIISAEIPNKDEDPEGYTTVQNHMMHGPYGPSNPTSPCMVENNCMENFPKRYSEHTIIDKDGFPIYRRRNNGFTINKRGIDLDNRYVVPYNRDLLMKYKAHICIEWYNRARSIKYLFKYLNKGPDRGKFTLEETPNDVNNQGQTKHVQIDEIKQYLDCRYLSPCEACWRIFNFETQHRELAVERLAFHLPGEQNVVFTYSSNLANVIQRENIEKTIFTEWMEANKKIEGAKDLTYVEFPTKFVWNKTTKHWTKRKSGNTIGRIYFAHPSSGERYYLRMLLNFVKGCENYEQIRTLNDIIYPNFRAACYARGLLSDDKEWKDCITEIALWACGKQIRLLFATILLHCEVAKPAKLWEDIWEIICEDIQTLQRKKFNFPTLKLSQEQIQVYALQEIETILRANGKSLKHYDGMGVFLTSYENEFDNRLVIEEMNIYQDGQDNFVSLEEKLNVDQRTIYDEILSSVEEKRGDLIFVYGHGGTGKTFLWKTILSKLRSHGKIALVVATSAIAALLLPGGRTVHSRFCIPINLTAESTCEIKHGSKLSELIQKTSLIIWDEAAITNKYCFEAVDHTLRDILKFTNKDSLERLFGGLTVALGGDFRQILPVIPKGTREPIIDASIKRSYLWKYVKLYNLSINMRLDILNKENEELKSLKDFADWILHIGDGNEENYKGESWVDIPRDLILDTGTNSLEAIVESTYPNLREHLKEWKYLQERTILAPTNEIVDEINNYMMKQIEGDIVTYHSSDSISDISGKTYNEDILYPPEFLNSLKFPGIPNHELQLKIGVPIMLIRNINQSAGLCNGT